MKSPWPSTLLNKAILTVITSAVQKEILLHYEVCHESEIFNQMSNTLPEIKSTIEFRLSR